MRKKLKWIDRNDRVPNNSRLVFVSINQDNGEEFTTLSFYREPDSAFDCEVRDGSMVVAWAERPKREIRRSLNSKHTNKGGATND